MCQVLHSQRANRKASREAERNREPAEHAAKRVRGEVLVKVARFHEQIRIHFQLVSE